MYVPRIRSWSGLPGCIATEHHSIFYWTPFTRTCSFCRTPMGHCRSIGLCVRCALANFYDQESRLRRAGKLGFGTMDVIFELAFSAVDRLREIPLMWSQAKPSNALRAMAQRSANAQLSQNVTGTTPVRLPSIASTEDGHLF